MSTLKVNNVQKSGSGGTVFLQADAAGTVTFPHSVTVGGDVNQAGTPAGPTYYDFNVGEQINFTSPVRGRLGPTLSQARAELAGQARFSEWGNNINYFDVVNGVHFWVVPQTGTYYFEVRGSLAGDLAWDGRGRGISGSYNLTAGEILRIQVGQKGNTAQSQFSGGGGASTVAKVIMGYGYKPILIGSGGSGQTPNDPSEAGRNSSRDARYAYSTDFQGTNTPEPGRGSLYQNGYGSDITNYWYGGGGGSWCVDGEEGTIGYWPSSLARPGNKGIRLEDQQSKGGWSEVGAHGGFPGGGSTGRGSGSGGGGGGWRGGDTMYTEGSTASDNGGRTATCYYDEFVASPTDLGLIGSQGSVLLRRDA